MTSLWKDIRPVLAAIARSRRVLFLLDFDGTLCEFVPKPEHAALTPEQRRSLRALRSPSRRLTVISGRSLPELKPRVAIRDAVYGGNFGLQIEGPRLRFLHAGVASHRGALAGLEQRLLSLTPEFPGILVEDKRYGIALHYGGLRVSQLRKLQARLKRLRADERSAGLAWWRRGSSWEIVPDVRWDKGQAALFLWRRWGKPYLIAAGDDEVDEPLFAAARGRGLSIRVGKAKSSRARYWVKDVSELYRFLELLPSQAA